MQHSECYQVRGVSDVIRGFFPALGIRPPDLPPVNNLDNSSTERKRTKILFSVRNRLWFKVQLTEVNKSA